MSRILLGVSGGIAAYKACDLTRLLVKAGHEVIPLVTPGAERFVRAETFAALARRPAGEDLYLHLTRADVLVVAPCTANTFAKLAHGLSDNLLTEAALAHRAEQLLTPGTLAGKRVVVTAGGTREPLDAARFVGNRSSGRMGVALAEESRRRGAEVVLLAANLAVPAPAGVETIPTPTAESMLDAALALADFDIALLAAAVADYRPAAAIAEKRTKGAETWTVDLEPTADIARRLGEEKRPGQLLVTFGADLGEGGL